MPFGVKPTWTSRCCSRLESARSQIVRPLRASSSASRWRMGQTDVSPYVASATASVTAVGRVGEQQHLEVRGGDPAPPRPDAAGPPGGDVDEVHVHAVAAPGADRDGPPVRRERHRLLGDGAAEAHRPSRRLPGPQVGEAHDAVPVPGREQPPVRADRGARHLDRRQPAGEEQAGVALQRRQQLPAGLHAVLQLDGGDAVEHRLPEVLRGLRERPDAFGVRPQRLRLGPVALVDAEDAGADGEDQEDGCAGEQPAQAPVRPPLGTPLALILGDAGVEEGALGGVELGAAAFARARSRPRAGRRGRGRTSRGRRRPRVARRRRAAGGRGCPRGPPPASGAVAATRGSAPRARPPRSRR